VIYLAQPTDHFQSKLDVGCAVNTQLFIRDDKLHQIVTMRSSDLILGIPYDLGIFTMLQEVLAFDLGVDVGSYVHHSNSLHIYDRNFEIAEAVVNSPVEADCPPMPHMTSKPPTDDLLAFEKNCRLAGKAKDKDLLETAFLNLDQFGFDPYWKDWAKILAGHWMKKCDRKRTREIYDGCEFEGFKRFKK
jgi:thymidylate synthase